MTSDDSPKYAAGAPVGPARANGAAHPAEPPRPQRPARPTGAPARAVRADVRRNRARLIGAAREMFERDGAGASLEGVARLAGVGIGTLYRHFPARQDLLEALLADAYAELAARARELTVSPEPGDALLEWLREFVARITVFPGLAAAAMVSLRDGRPETSRAVRADGEALFARARAAGDVPADVAFLDVLRLAGAVATIAEYDPDTAGRLLALAATGMVPGKAGGPRAS